MKDIDIYRTATLLIQQHEEAAIQEASARMADLMEQGDYAGALVWLKIGKAINDMVDCDAKIVH